VAAMSDLLWLPLEPFQAYGFMRRALVACFALAMACGPLGVLLLLRRMSLSAEAMAHAVLPGIAIGFLLAGTSVAAMTTGGLVAGLIVAVVAAAITRTTVLREDASFAAFYLISLALGVMIVSLHGSSVDLTHVLFGSVLGVDDASLVFVASVSTITVLALAVAYRPLIMECFDPGFLRSVGGRRAAYHTLFVMLVVLNLVAGFQALGTLMVSGLMILPAAAARFWARDVWTTAAISAVLGFASGFAGLAISFYQGVPSGPGIVLTAGAVYLFSLAAGPHGAARTRFTRARHYGK
jgi:zinc/manganese transport system permease protein